MVSITVGNVGKGERTDGVRYGGHRTRGGGGRRRDLAIGAEKNWPWWLSSAPGASDCGGQGPGICISNKFPGDTAVAGPGATLRHC